MEKVKVSKDVFKALRKVETNPTENLGTLIKRKALQFDFKYEPFTALNKLTFNEVLDIYKYGYELEETPEEKALEYYRKMCPLGTYTRTCVQDILTILDIKIKGINE